MIQLRSVTKKYKNNYALKNINLDILSGEFVFITGASGAGKSTLMKMLYKEETPTTGTVLIGGINIANLPSDKVPNLRRCMGIVFQDYKLLQNQSVYDNMRFQDYDEETDSYTEIYQWFISDCSEDDVEYLERNFGLLFTYSDLLDKYILCVDHFGTSWDYVHCEVLTYGNGDGMYPRIKSYKELTGQEF